MKSIKYNSKSEIIIKNSKFICYLYRINNVEDINDTIDRIKDIYPDATHYCYGYIVDNIIRSSDDGEPSKTAGIPILKVLENNNLNKVLAIVVRYFGGIKLGANGLIRAYSKCVSMALNNNEIVNLVKGYNIDINFNYERSKEIDYILKDYKIIKKDYLLDIKYNLDIPIDFIEVLNKNNINYIINKDIYLED